MKLYFVCYFSFLFYISSIYLASIQKSGKTRNPGKPEHRENQKTGKIKKKIWATSGPNFSNTWFGSCTIICIYWLNHWMFTGSASSITRMEKVIIIFNRNWLTYIKEMFCCDLYPQAKSFVILCILSIWIDRCFFFLKFEINNTKIIYLNNILFKSKTRIIHCYIVVSFLYVPLFFS